MYIYWLSVISISNILSFTPEMTFSSANGLFPPYLLTSSWKALERDDRRGKDMGHRHRMEDITRMTLVLLHSSCRMKCNLNFNFIDRDSILFILVSEFAKESWIISTVNILNWSMPKEAHGWIGSVPMLVLSATSVFYFSSGFLWIILDSLT